MKRPGSRIVALMLAAAAALMLTGCSRDMVRIESNTFWDGVINNNIRIYGQGNRTYEIHGKLGCVTVQKTYLDTLYLRLQISGQPMEQTTAPLGTIIQCK